MRWRVLVPLLVLVLLGALSFSLWPVGAPDADLRGARVPAILAPPRSAPGAQAREPLAAPPATGPAPVATPPVPAPPSVPANPLPRPGPGAETLAEAEQGPKDLEPEDGGVLHPISREGIREAVRLAQPELKECYEAWLQQRPDLGGRVRVIFTIAHVPGRERGKVIDVDTPPDAGLGHLAFEGCVRNVFAGLRFEKPPSELHVTYPLTFLNEPPASPQ